MGVVFNIEITLCMDPSKSAFRTYGHLFCMKTVAKLIIRVMFRVIVGLCKLINTGPKLFQGR